MLYDSLFEVKSINFCFNISCDNYVYLVVLFLCHTCRVYEIEKRVETSDKYMFPNFEILHWYAAKHIQDHLKGTCRYSNYATMVTHPLEALCYDSLFCGFKVHDCSLFTLNYLGIAMVMHVRDICS